MENIILESNELFNLMDYHVSHQKLLLRATVVNHQKQNFHNIDILFGGVSFMMLKPHFLGLEISTTLVGELLPSLPEDIFYLLNTYNYYKCFELKTEGNIYYIVATSVKIVQNTLDASISSIKK